MTMTKEVFQSEKNVHIIFSFVIMFVIMILDIINDQSVISAIFSVAGYTYGPLLGLYAFGLFTEIQIKDHLVPYIAVFSPIISYAIQHYFSFGFEITHNKWFNRMFRIIYNKKEWQNCCGMIRKIKIIIILCSVVCFLKMIKIHINTPRSLSS